MAATETLERLRRGALALLAAAPASSLAVMLPEDRTDALYHSYDGGGVEVTGPALLVRKDLANQVSFYGNLAADSISSASVDVVTTASPYDDQRTEAGVGADYLYGDALLGLSFTFSDEDDYTANTLDMNIAQETLGGMTTLRLGFSRGWDEVSRVDTDFAADVDRYNYRVGVSQVLSPTRRLDVDYEGISDRGYLANPYRSARVLGASVPERYPGTRTSNALAVRGVQALRERASVRLEYRYFWDTWSIQAHTFEAAYTQYLGRSLLAQVHARLYSQDGASFYSDNFDREYNYMARDKELSSFSDQSVGFRLTYVVLPDHAERWPARASVDLSYDFVRYDYDDFTDLRDGQPYESDAHVMSLMFSIWY